MKRTLYFSIGALMALCTVSCMNNEKDNKAVEEQQASYVSAEICDDETKTHLDNENYVVWDAADQILIKGSNGTATYELFNGAGTTKGKFKKISGVDLTGSSFVAYSPATFFDGEKEVWPTTQQYVSTGLISGAPMTAETSSLDEVLQFKNKGGILRLNLKTTAETKKIAYIKIETEDCEVVLNCPTDGVSVGTTAIPFYIALPAKEAYKKFVVEVTEKDGSAFQKIATKDIKIERSKITTIAATMGELKYLVSVSPTDKVIFAPGNLYGIDNGDGTYSFAFEAKQTDYRMRVGYGGEKAVINGVATTTPEKTSGLFQWAGRKISSAAAKASFGAFSEKTIDKDDFISDFPDVADFGKALGEGSKWRALTYTEWNYLMNIREVQGKTGYGNTCVWAQVSGTQGLIIFHDGYTGQTSGLTELPKDCIFLPDGGYAKIDFNGDGSVKSRSIPDSGRGMYWTNDIPLSATAPSIQAGSIRTDRGELDLSFGYRERGYSVRLVSDDWNN